MRNPEDLQAGQVWVLGAGYFGRKALDFFSRSSSAHLLTVVDKEPDKLNVDGIHAVCREAVSWLSEQLHPETPVSWIIPAVPCHVAAKWLRIRLQQDGCSISPVEIAEADLPRFPNALRLGGSQVVVSHADFTCPEDCPEPDEVCSQTGSKRNRDMFELLALTKIQGFTPLVVRSRQISPGVGGLLPADLWRLFHEARRLKGEKLLIATACRCHGIMDGMLVE